MNAAREARLLTVAGHTMATSVQLLIVGVATSVVLARLLGPAGKGAYDLALATAGLIATFGGLSLHSGLTYHVARAAVRIRAVLRALGGYDLAVVAVGAAILWLVHDGPGHGLLLPPDPGTATVLGMVLLAGVLTVATQGRAILVGLGRIRASNARDLVQNAVLLALLGGAAAWNMWAGPVTYRAAIWFAVAANGLGAALFLAAVLREPDPGGSDGFGAVVRYSVPAHSSNVAQFLNYRLDFFLVSFFIDLSALGLYAVAVGLARLLWIASRAASQVLLPEVAASGADAETTTAVVTRISLWMAVLGAAVFVLGGEALLRLLYGGDFVGSYRPLMLLLVGAVPFTLSNTLAAHLGGLGLPHLNFRASLAGLVVTVVLDLLLIPEYGIAGAAVATSASYVVTTGTIMVLFRRRARVSLVRLVLPQREDLGLLHQVAQGAYGAFRVGGGDAS